MRPRIILLAAVMSTTVAIAADLDDLYRTGAAAFADGEVEASLEAFDELVERFPDRKPELWQRGISLYYAERYEDCVDQFESHRTVNPYDAENSVWHYLCVEAFDGEEAARERFIPARDDRVPMMAVHRLFAGEGTPEEVFAAAGEARVPSFYAHLYVALWHESRGDAAKTRHHLERSLEGGEVGHYMETVARVHLEHLVASKIDAIFEEFTKPGSPGAAVSVIRDGEVVFTKGYGLANLEHEIPITPRSVFYLGSVSKQFVAAAIALLEQEGKLSLDDDVRKYVPELPDYGTPITIRHLIQHTSGLRDYLELTGLAGLEIGNYHDDAEVVELLARQKGLNFTPGEKHLYSNSGYFLLAVIVEKASGKSLKDYAEEKIFGPLGMEDTHFHDDYMHLIPRRASGYFPGPGKSYRHFLSTFDRVGSGGVFSSVEDLYRWDQNFYSGKVGGQELIEKLHERGRLNDGEELDYAFGLVHGEHNGLRVVQHGGALGGYRSTLVRLPDERFSVIVLANVSSANPGGLAMEVVDLFLAGRYEKPQAAPEAEAPETVEVPREELERVTGDYWNHEESYARRIYIDSRGTPIFSRGMQSQSKLAPLGDDRFRMLGVPVTVEVAFGGFRDGKATEMRVVVDGRDPVVSEAYVPVVLSADEAQAYAGNYYCEELPVDVTLFARGSNLFGRTPDQQFPLFPGIPDVFSVENLIVRFRRDDEKRVVGFVLDAGRVKGLQFVRE